MRNEVIRSQLAGQPFILCPKAMDSLIEFANQDTPRAASVSEVANNSVTYEKQGSVAIISVDGGMYKKDIGGMCSSVASYDQMVKMIDKAEADDEIKTMLFRVDTPGGSVAGADEVGDKIYNSKKKTVCLYENIGASGGIWVFSACDELYATETTILGSIGVIVSYLEPTGDTGYKRVSIVSKNASNKDCSLNGDCKNKMQNMLDSYEAMFYARVERNTGFTADRIKTVFNDGDVIFATVAKEEGFIKGVITFDALLGSLQSGASPIVSNDVKSTNHNQGAVMAQEESLLGRLQAMLGMGADMSADQSLSELEASLTAANAKLSSLSDEINEAKATLATETQALAAARSELAEAEKFKAEVTTRLLEAKQTGVSIDVAVAMIEAETAEEASRIAIASKTSTGASAQGGPDVSKEKAEHDYAVNFAKQISVS